MPQNPTPSTLLVTEIKAGAGVSVSPASGTGIVTITAGVGSIEAGTGLTVTLGTSSTVQIGTLPTVLIASATGTVVANGVTPVVVAAASVTANSQILFTLKTVGGTVGIPHVVTITAGTGFNFASAASDTSTYNYTIVG